MNWRRTPKAEEHEVLKKISDPFVSFVSFVVKYLFLLVAALSRRGEIYKENNRRVQWKIH
jgi:hypothetical protein